MMKEIKNIILFTVFMSMFGIKAFPNDIAVKNQDGVTIYYNWINNNTELEVSYMGNISPSDDWYIGCYSGNVVIPESVTYNGSTYSVTTIHKEAFSGCHNLTSVTIPTSVTSIGLGAFSGCSGLTSINIPNSVTSIGEYAFRDCSVLTSITIPNDVTSIGGGAFEGTAWYNNQPDGVIYAGIILYKYKGTMPAGTKISIKEGTVGITDTAFDGCSGLTSVSIPNSVTSIGNVTFRECTGLTSITIPNSVTKIGSNTFKNCTNLTSITIPNSVTSIGPWAFTGCASLTSITIPNSVTKIEHDTFENCTCLTSITIPNSVTSIGNGVFSGCESLTKIIVESGNSVYDSRDNCNAIIETDNNTLVMGCKKTTIPNSVTSIGYRAFSGCSGLTSITIPNSVTYINESAFNYCSGLTTIKVESNNRVYDSRNNCNAIIETESNTLIAGCKTTIFPNNVTSIGNSAFYGCGGLTSVTIANSVTSIGCAAFACCSSLTTVTIPNSVTSISGRAFSLCNLTEVISEITSPYIIDNDVFYGSYNATLIVPVGKIRAYKKKAGWNMFRIIKDVNDAIGAKVVIDKKEAILGNGQTMTLTATVYPSALEDKSVTWKSTKTNVATVTNDGTVTGVSVGTTKIICTSNATQVRDTCIVTVGNVKLNKTEAILEKYKTMTLIPMFTPSTMTDKSVVWKSSNTAVATVSSSGEVYGVKAGTATITCTSVMMGTKATCEVLVGYVKLDKNETILEKTKTMTLKASVYPSKLEDKSVTWKSSNTAVATVSNSGKVKGIKAGIANITCTSIATGLKTTCKVTVGYVKFEESEYIVEKYKTITLTPTVYPSTLTDKSVTWKSSNTKVATVSSDGEVYGVKAGTATITCTSKATGVSTTCKVTVSYVKFEESEYIVEKYKTITLTPTVYPSSLTDKSVTWKSSNTKVATVTSNGKVTGVKAGTATITCTSKATGVSTTCNVTVGYVKLDQTEAIVEKTKTMTLKATVYPSKLEDKSVTWTSSNTAVATVTSKGKVKGIKAGKATITCTSNATGLSTTCKVTVGYVKLDQTEVSVKKGKTLTLTATVYPSSLTDKSVTWESSDKSVATVTSAGKVKGIAAGTATITCTSNATGLSTTCIVTVKATSGSRSLEGDDDEATGIENLDKAIEPFDVYDLRGQKVRHQVTSLDGLPAGIYIVNGRKVLKK